VKGSEAIKNPLRRQRVLVLIQREIIPTELPIRQKTLFYNKLKSKTTNTMKNTTIKMHMTARTAL
jgi:hypothetical protein